MGPEIAARLIAEGHRVFVFHRGTYKPPGGVAGEVRGDRNELARYADKLLALKPDILIDMVLMTETQARQVVKLFGTRMSRLVVASSCDVYLNYDLLLGRDVGEVDGSRLTEQSSLRQKLYVHREHASGPEDVLYDYDKILVERTVLASESAPAVVVRLPMVFGPNDYQHRLYPYLKRMLDNRPAILLGESQARARMCRAYARDCAHALALAALHDKAESEIYNVSLPTTETEREWVARIGRRADWDGNIITVPDDNLPDHLQSSLHYQHHLDIDSSKIRGQLGYAELSSVDDALDRTIAWESANPPDKLEPGAFNYPAEDAVLMNDA